MAVQILFLVEVLLAAFVLWIGLYSITRDLPWRREAQRIWQRPPLMAGAGMILGSIYLFGNAMKMVSTTPEEFVLWQRFTLWGIPIAIVCFFVAVVELTCSGRPAPQWVRALILIVAVIAVALGFAIAGGYLFDAETIRAGTTVFQPFYLPQRVPYGDLYYGFVVAGILGSIAVLLHRLPKTAGDADRRQKVLIGIAGGAFLLVGLLSTLLFAELRHPYLPMHIGDLLAAMGAVAVSYDIARHNALKHRQIIRSDFWHSFVSVAITALLCLFIYLAFSAVFSYPVQPLSVALICVFIVLTHTSFNWGDAVLDRLFLPRWVVGYRDQLMLMRQQPLTAEDPADPLAMAEQTFDAVLQATRTQELESLIQGEVEGIFKYRNFDDDELLSESRLFGLQIVQAAVQEYAQDRDIEASSLSDHHRAECLRSLLCTAIDEWSWTPDPLSRRARIEKTILGRKYVEQRSRVDVERLLSDQFDVVITGGGYSRCLIDARMHLARALYDRELAYAHPG